MVWPRPTDYSETIQTPELCFDDAALRQAQVVETAPGQPRQRAGDFAQVYQVQGAEGQTWAVKCFTQEDDSLEERYRTIAAHLQRGCPAFMVPFEYLPVGIRVHGRWFPVLKMDWIEGIDLSEFVRRHADKPETLYRLAKKWVKLSLQQRLAQMAHGDLQHANVLLAPGAKPTQLSLRLVDYDGMYVPGLDTGRPGETGHPHYQHPERTREGLYGLDMDRFSHLVIYTTLRALAVGGSKLLQKHSGLENLLFREQDFLDPTQSELLVDLWKLPDSDLRRLVGHLVLGTQMPADKVPILDEVVGAEGRPLALTAKQERLLQTLLPPAAARMTVAEAEVAQPPAQEQDSEIGAETLQGAAVDGGVAVIHAPSARRTASAPQRSTTADEDEESSLADAPSVGGSLFLPSFQVRCRHCGEYKHLFLPHCPHCCAADAGLFVVALVMAVLGTVVAWLALPASNPDVIGIGGGVAVVGVMVALPLAIGLATLLLLGWREPHANALDGPRWPASRQICTLCGAENYQLLFMCRNCGCIGWHRLTTTASLAVLLAIFAVVSYSSASAAEGWQVVVGIGRWAMRLVGALAAFTLCFGTLEIWNVQRRLSTKERTRSRLGRIILGFAVPLAIICYLLLFVSLFTGSTGR